MELVASCGQSEVAQKPNTPRLMRKSHPLVMSLDVRHNYSMAVSHEVHVVCDYIRLELPRSP